MPSPLGHLGMSSNARLGAVRVGALVCNLATTSRSRQDLRRTVDTHLRDLGRAAERRHYECCLDDWAARSIIKAEGE